MRSRAFAAVTVLLLATSAMAGPGTLTYQGSLLDSGGQPVPDGIYHMRFALYAVETGGMHAWTETDTAVQVTNGLFSTVLGDGQAFGSVFADNALLWFEVAIDVNHNFVFDTNETYGPRRPMAGAAWATDSDGLEGQPAAAFQRRVTGSAAPGTFITAINEDGSVVTGVDQAGTGDITSVICGAGLSGGGTSGDVTVAVEFAGAGSSTTVARSDHDHAGTYAPTGHVHDASDITSGVLDNARLGTSVTLQGNAFNAPNRLVQLDGSGRLPGVDGSLLTGIAAGQVGALVSVDGVSNAGGNVDLVQADSITLTPNDGTNNITIGETHSARTDNPQIVTAAQTGAPVAVDGVANSGGNIDLVQANSITITPNDGTNNITIGETHSARMDNPHNVTASQIGAWRLTGNSGTTTGTNFVGTTDDIPLDLRVNNRRGLRLEWNTLVPNVIGGSDANYTTAGVYGSTIAGGGGSSVGMAHKITDSYGTIAGGIMNQAGSEDANNFNAPYAAVGGGLGNVAAGNSAVVAGGYYNRAEHSYATIGGGFENATSQPHTTISGGRENRTGGWYAAVGGGLGNRAGAQAATVGGGEYNATTQSYATISGGSTNRALGQYATVGGGRENTAGNTYSTVCGGRSNSSSYTYTVIAGGWANVVANTYGSILGGYGNSATAYAATVGGGTDNNATGQYATVPGGQLNNASGSHAIVAGGSQNMASGGGAAVVGGESNVAQQLYGFAAGRRAKSLHQGAFVWADSQNADFVSQRNDQFRVRADGGVRLDFNGGSWVEFYNSGGRVINTMTGAFLSTAGNWTNVSDRSHKENFTAVDGLEVLEKVARLPVSTWNHKAEDASIRHIGPTAQDFHAAFGFGDNDKSIGTLDADGVALAAIQGLYQAVQEKDAQIAAQRQEIDDLKTRLAAIEARLVDTAPTANR